MKNKRLQEYNTSLQQYNSNLQDDDALKNGETIKFLQKDKTAMMETLAGVRDQSCLLKNQIDTIRTSQHEEVKQRSELQQVSVDRDHTLVELFESLDVEFEKLVKIVAPEETCSSQQAQLKNVNYQLATANEKLKTSQHEAVKQRSELQKVSVDRDLTLVELFEILDVEFEKLVKTFAPEETCSSQQATANEKFKRADLTSTETLQENEANQKMVNEMQIYIIDLERQLVEAEKLRKMLHNTILELKGNIRVFCRVRPTLPEIDGRGADGIAVSYPTSVENLGRDIELMQNMQKFSFTFDKVFGHEASQEDVFVEISQLVQSALDGYKVCIFAYGQTGSGKTYTMMGKPEAREEKGLIPRSIEQIFEASQSLKSQGWKYKLQASMLEIYNETIRDLLPSSRCCSSGRIPINKQFTLKCDPAGNTHVSDLTVVDVCSINEVSSLLKQAAQSRSAGKTQMNEQSSRSHFVFTLRISGVNDITEQQVQGILNLIDLAGSEHLDKSGATGDRLKETQAINKSLSALSDVLFSIAKDHVPYRNSKLTYLLQPCLGGDSKTLMFVNISPEASSASESICSLQFAARVNA